MSEDTSKLGIGTDEWVAQHEKRLQRRAGLPGVIDLLNQRVSDRVRYSVLALVAIFFGFGDVLHFLNEFGDELHLSSLVFICNWSSYQCNSRII